MKSFLLRFLAAMLGSVTSMVHKAPASILEQKAPSQHDMY
ncbi:Unknown protein sequence [Pseudomonas amygdali pv. lachrymans]|uniref:Cyclic lactone autoinducer peptide n=1 Tax=Pseudomonas amygdali pv. lachrymans TaxID=53707 RepID=A0ABR5KTA3_PSEAV|nr:Unknown protein sequence [Pseudomonas amygdali pv. lachrymans]KPC18066.1 Unknown protein sequence [Pseudomonas amygdali pv. lachrymans]RMT05754.1 hypothetical protein ALP54_102921 [Pseudomonas amygdali pv. lachrymans]